MINMEKYKRMKAITQWLTLVELYHEMCEFLTVPWSIYG